ncbi:MAG TPA: OsmC family protein [Bacteroidia bacterium]|nr:OsmC family protein [Bacteroidia bacterium]
MITSIVKYTGNKNTQAIHVRSNSVIETDAPPDNNGKGEKFSPTDLLATSLASCMITIMSILAERENIPLEVSAEVTKIMADNPRRVGEILIKLSIKDFNYTDKQKKMLENAAYTCPVAKSLHPDIQQKISIIWY